VRTLRHGGLVELVRGNEWRAPHLKPATHLQQDFSINHTLALWLYDTLPKLDRAAETYARDVMTLVESILEDPQAVIWAQLDKARGEAVAEMKARGMDYEDRMAELEKVEHPKPLRDFVYQTFNAFADRHPWVSSENIRPKSVAREMVETFASFNDYVRDYGLQRSEGQLLRYLTDAYKTLVQSVPEDARDEELEEIIAFLRQVVRGVDSSLLDEWELLRDPLAARRTGAAELRPARPADETEVLRRDPKKRAARVRSELHRLLGALARKEWDEARRAIRNDVDPEPQMAAYFAEHDRVDLTPRARRPDRTVLTEDGPLVWRAQQRFGPPPRPAAAHEEPAGDEADWTIECTVDLREPLGDGPSIALVRIGT
jgi:hypothetical protein